MSLTFSSTAGFIGIVTTSPKTLQLPAISARNGRVITFKDKTGLAALNPITLLVNGADRFETGASIYVINQNYGTITIVGHLAATGDGGINTWNIIQQTSMPYTNANFSTLVTSSLSLWDRGGLSGLAGTASTIQSSGILTMNTGSLLVNGSTIAFTGQLQSTVLGLNTYISSFIDPTELTSTVVGLGTANYVSTFGLSFSLTSTVVGLGTSGYVSSFQLLSTTVGVYGAITSNIANTVGPEFQSTVVNLGMVGYVSTSQLTSTVGGLGTAGYVSSTQLTSTITGIGASFTHSNLFIPLGGVPATSTNQWFTALFSTTSQGVMFGGSPASTLGGFAGIAPLSNIYPNLISSHQIYIADETTALQRLSTYNTLTIEQAGEVMIPFYYTGANQTYTVPIGVTAIYVQLSGAGGGAGTNSAGGAGGLTTGYLSVTPGQVLTLLVGQAGSTGSASSAFGGGGATQGAKGGGGGGRSAIQLSLGGIISSASGDGTNVTYTTSSPYGLTTGTAIVITGLTPSGYNGSFILRVVTATTFAVTNNNTGASSSSGTIVADLVVAGGAGGGGDLASTQGGAGGGLSGASGALTGSGLTASTGGSQSAGGIQTQGSAGGGTLGTGGMGGVNSTTYYGGGGGGGYWGGAGGGARAGPAESGGGGGSAYIANLTSGTTIQGGGVAPATNGYIVIQTGPIRGGNYIEVRDGVSKFLLDRNMNVGINVTTANNPQIALQVGGSTLMSSLTTGVIDLVDRTTNALNHLITSNGSLYYNGSAITTGAVSALTGSGPITTSGSGTVTIGFADNYVASLSVGSGLGALTITSNITAYNGSNLTIYGPNLQNYVSTANLTNLVSTANLTNLVSTANLTNLVSTANLTNLVSTANLTNLVSTTNLAGLISTANLAFLVSTANLTNLVSTANLTNLVSTANLTNLVSTTNLAGLISTANLTNLVSTANLAYLVSTANLANLVSTANLTNLVSTANLANMVSTSLLSTFGQNLAYYYGYISSLSNVSSISTTLAVTSSFSGNLADAMTLILYDL